MTVALWESTVLTEPAAPSPNLDEERLLVALRAGEGDAFESIYRKRVGAVYGLAYRLAGRPAEAEELTQEVFVRAWEHRAGFKSVEHLARWLRRVAVNCWINGLRRRGGPTGPPGSVDELDADDAAFATAPAPPGLQLDLERALASLTPRLRAVVTLYDVYGLGHEEIAEALEMTPGASKVQLHRARTRLREMLR